jgi:7-carboxy-7-deazaguanine synthase
VTAATTRTEQRLRIVEPFGTFGPTFQGEGPSAGERALFVRLSRCNLSCPGCDTPESWDWSRFHPHADSSWASVDELLRWIRQRDATELVVVTGGEPLLQQRGVLTLVEALREDGHRVEIETNGTTVPSSQLVTCTARFNVSPKLAAFGAGMSRSRRIVAEALESFASSGKAIFKFVASGVADLEEIEALVGVFGLAPVWVMPSGTTHEDIVAGLRALAEPVLARGWNLTGRLHILLWGDARGR